MTMSGVAAPRARAEDPRSRGAGRAPRGDAADRAARRGRRASWRGRAAGSSRRSRRCRSPCARRAADIERALDSRAWRWGTSSPAPSRASRDARCAPKARSRRLWRGSSACRAPRTSICPRARRGRGPRRVALARGRRDPLAGEQAPMSPEQERELERRRGALAAELRRRLGPAPERERWPSVSVIVPTRDGRHRPRAAVRGPDRAHALPGELEVVVVDNGSSDGTLAYLEDLETPFPVHVARDRGEPVLRAGQRARGRSERAASCCCS